jgi:hypothetical protein
MRADLINAPQGVDIDLGGPVWRVDQPPPLMQITSPDPRSYLAGVYRDANGNYAGCCRGRCRCDGGRISVRSGHRHSTFPK